MMPHVDGLAIAREAHRCSPGALVIIITGFASLETTLEAIKLGVYDYITKPFQVDEFRLLVSNASKRIRLEREVRALRERLGAAESRNAELQSICEGLSHEIDTLRHELERFGALNLDTGPASIRPVPRGEGKIGVYEKMANDFRIRLMHLREVVEAQNDTSAEP